MRKKEKAEEVKEERIKSSSVSILKPTKNLPCTFSKEGLNTEFQQCGELPLLSLIHIQHFRKLSGHR